MPKEDREIIDYICTLTDNKKVRYERKLAEKDVFTKEILRAFIRDEELTTFFVVSTLLPNYKMVQTSSKVGDFHN
jgi:hypothetical protein